LRKSHLKGSVYGRTTDGRLCAIPQFQLAFLKMNNEQFIFKVKFKLSNLNIAPSVLLGVYLPDIRLSSLWLYELLKMAKFVQALFPNLAFAVPVII